MMNKKSSVFTFLALLVTLGIALDLRIYHNALVPGWYNDEGTLINIANNLNLGHLEYLGIQDSLLISARQPLFVWLLAFLFRLFGSGIQTLRTFTGILGVINTGLIFLILRKQDRFLALLCALTYALFPKAILYSRLGFSYNLVALLVLLSFWASYTYLKTGQRRFIFTSALFLGLGLLSDLVAFAFIPVIIIIVLWKRWKDLFITFGLIILPFSIYSVVMLLIAPEAFLFDFNNIFFRVSSSSLPVQFISILINSGWVYQDILFLLGIFGILLYPSARLKKILLLFILIPFLLISRTNPIVGQANYFITPLIPFYAMGAGYLLYLFSKSIYRFSHGVYEQALSHFNINHQKSGMRLLSAAFDLVFIILLILSPLIFNILNTHYQIQTSTYQTGFEWVSIDVTEAVAAVNFINANVESEDVVLTSPALAWAMHGNASDYQISIAQAGYKTVHFPSNIPEDRFRFDVDYRQAKYIVIDNIWRNWAENIMPDLKKVRLFAEQSPLVFQTENIMIYKIE